MLRVFFLENGHRFLVYHPAIEGPWLFTAEATEARQLAEPSEVPTIGADPFWIATIEPEKFGHEGFAFHPESPIELDRRTVFVGGNAIEVPEGAPRHDRRKLETTIAKRKRQSLR